MIDIVQTFDEQVFDITSRVQLHALPVVTTEFSSRGVVEMSAIAIGPRPAVAPRRARYQREVPAGGAGQTRRPVPGQNGRPVLTLVPSTGVLPSADEAAEMSELASTREPASARGRSGSMRLTRRGRLVFSLLAAALALGAIFGGRAVADGPEQALEVRSHVIQPGDTWWSLASDVALPGEDVRDVVQELVDLNGRSSAGLIAGQSVVLPASR